MEALTVAVDVFLTTLEGTISEEQVGLVWYNDLVGTAQTLMQTVADIGGGRYWHAENLVELRDAYVEIAKDIPTVLTE